MSKLTAILRSESDQNPAAEAPARITGVVIGRLTAIGAREVMLTHPLTPAQMPVAARLLGAAEGLAVGDEVAVMFAGGDPAQPLVMGRMEVQGQSGFAALEISSDHEQAVIRHPRKLTLSVGKATLSLDAEGRVELSGEYLLSHAKGLNRIAGASVKVN